MPQTPEHIKDMVHISRELQRHNGYYSLMPLPHRQSPQMMQMVDTQHTNAELWFEHIAEIDDNEIMLSSGIVDEADRFLMYRQTMSFEGIAESDELVLPGPLLDLARLDKQVINNTHPAISRKQLLEPASALTFSRYYEDIYWLRNQLHL